MALEPRILIHVDVYKISKERVPFLDWLHALKDFRARAMVRVRINRIRLGNFGNHHSVGEGVWEIKIDTGPGYRIYYGLETNTLVILLTGGNKRSQHHDIKKAKIYWQNYKTGRKREK